MIGWWLVATAAGTAIGTWLGIHPVRFQRRPDHSGVAFFRRGIE